MTSSSSCSFKKPKRPHNKGLLAIFGLQHLLGFWKNRRPGRLPWASNNKMQRNNTLTQYQLFYQEMRPRVIAELQAEMGANYTPRAVMARLAQLWRERKAEEEAAWKEREAAWKA